MPPVIIPPVHPAPDDESDHTVSDTETIRSESAELDDDDIANHPYYMEEMNPWLDPYWPADLDELAYVQSYGLDLFPYSRWENTRLGDFRDGKWWCCCDQPLEAAHRQTLKVNRNYGRLCKSHGTTFPPACITNNFNRCKADFTSVFQDVLIDWLAYSFRLSQTISSGEPTMWLLPVGRRARD